MILKTKAAKVVLVLIALCLLFCAVFLLATDPETETTISTSSSESAVSTNSAAIAPPSNPINSLPAPPLPAASFDITGVYLDPVSLQSSAGQVIDIKVVANITDSGISGGEFQLTYDTSAFQAIKLTPGHLLGESPLIGVEQIDNEAGSVQYALARKGMTQITDSSGTLATVQLQILPSSQPGNYPMKLIYVKLTNEEFKETAGFEIRNGAVEISS